MTRIFLIRHAEPAASWGGADDDPGLTEKGRRQAEAAAAALRELGPRVVASSPMQRCRETAAPFAGLLGAEARIERRVSEVVAPPGIADRRTWLRDTFPWADSVPRRQWSSVQPELRSWRDAAVAAIREIDQDTAVFTHFIALNAIASAVLGSEDTIVFRPGHASITELEATPSGLRLVRFGDEMVAEDVR